MNIIWNFFSFIISNLIFTKTFAVFIVIYMAVSYILIGYIMKATEKYLQHKDEDKDTHDRFDMFRRLDGAKWDKNRLFIGSVLFAWLKLGGVIFSVLLCYCSVKILLIGRESIDHRDEKLKKKIIFITSFCAKIFMLCLGIVIRDKNVEYDYTKYLGKGYRKDLKPAAFISNHTSWIDILLFMDKLGAGFIASIHVKSFPLIGYVAQALGCIFVDRNDKSDRGNSLALVNDKLNNIYNNNDYSTFTIFPEGTTSNTTSILPFKKGSFTSKLPIKPYVIKFEVRERISLAMDVIDMLLHVFVVLCIPIHYIELYNLPVFCPNEYFFKEYNKGKEDWEVYAETMREIMCQVSGFDKAKGSWDSKKEYLDFLRKSKNNKDK
jgi:1-acyl-sn-glycerol-3-phosphate acyltransferase